ncbi:hypothetical protein AV530_009544 [Patagioenas fasciata monilis]|uniref:NHR domain-containing protein n=1 Tax=Patagioenas fasciata monilis TaxID=372326 RepID=A0A1V4KNA9_PATFA|nr:hypothetical protein AV530_009544 [Patagioenas fasciata monilis]
MSPPSPTPSPRVPNVPNVPNVPRALRDGELFEIVIQKMVDRWSGSIEAGVTAIRPEELEFPNTMTDIDYDTWMLRGPPWSLGDTWVIWGHMCHLGTPEVNVVPKGPPWSPGDTLVT